jgi:K+-transporting ATPase KdpC subunit
LSWYSAHEPFCFHLTSLSREPKAEARVASLQDGASWRPAIGLGLATLLLAGAVYAGIATGFAGLAYPTQAEGSLLRDGSGQVRGSAWLSQPFAGDGYFQARPSAANYDPMAAAGSNMARSNPALAERVAASTAAVAAREGVARRRCRRPGHPVRGGLDPHCRRPPRSCRWRAWRVPVACRWNACRRWCERIPKAASGACSASRG